MLPIKCNFSKGRFLASSNSLDRWDSLNLYPLKPSSFKCPAALAKESRSRSNSSCWASSWQSCQPKWSFWSFFRCLAVSLRKLETRWIPIRLYDRSISLRYQLCSSTFCWKILALRSVKEVLRSSRVWSASFSARSWMTTSAPSWLRSLLSRRSDLRCLGRHPSASSTNIGPSNPQPPRSKISKLSQAIRASASSSIPRPNLLSETTKWRICR
mmetsp:Transcript_88295/g.193506  ORF Transcript_88295/g.193506 Transcript_88295/m.193506 type:complete len:213 (-) Transcript_88295:1730-2368(-)